MKRILINLVLIILAFTIQNCIFPQIPFLSASPNLLLILTFSFGFICGKDAGMLCGFISGVLMDLFYAGPFGFYTLFFVYVGYVNGIFTKYYYEDYITLPLILSVFNELAYNIYIYIFQFLIQKPAGFSVLSQRNHSSGNHLYGAGHAAGLPHLPDHYKKNGRTGKKERY